MAFSFASISSSSSFFVCKCATAFLSQETAAVTIVVVLLVLPLVHGAASGVHKEIAHRGHLEAELLRYSHLHFFGRPLGLLENSLQCSPLNISENEAGLFGQRLTAASRIVGVIAVASRATILTYVEVGLVDHLIYRDEFRLTGAIAVVIARAVIQVVYMVENRGGAGYVVCGAALIGRMGVRRGHGGRARRARYGGGLRRRLIMIVTVIVAVIIQDIAYIADCIGIIEATIVTIVEAQGALV